MDTDPNPPPQSRAEEIQKKILSKRLAMRAQALEKEAEKIRELLQIVEYKQAVLEDFYLFAREVMGFSDLFEPLHRRVCSFISSPSKKKLLLIPRGHFKTTLASVSYPIWRLLKNCDERICLTSVTATLAEANFREILQRVRRDSFQTLFGSELGHPDHWPYCRISGEAVINRKGSKTGPSLYASGVDSSETGRHFSIMIMDDIVNDEKCSNPTVLDSVWDWFGRQMSVMDPDGEVILVGTRWHWDDPYSRVAKLPDWDNLILKAVNNGTPIFPTRFTTERLAEIKKLQGDFRYSCFYNNEPTGEGVNPFDLRKFQWLKYPPEDEKEKLEAWTYILIDPATTTEDYSCPTGIIIGDACSDSRFIVTKCVLRKMHPDELVDLVFTLVKDHSPQAVIIESEAQQKTYYSWFRREMFHRHEHFFIEEAKLTKNIGKHYRLVALQPFLHNGIICFAEGMEGAQDLKEEFATYPKGPHDDLICALSFATYKIKFPSPQKQPSTAPPEPRISLFLQDMIEKHHRSKRRGRFPRIRIHDTPTQS